jgi:NADH-quinone oxidoreductase subunit C
MNAKSQIPQDLEHAFAQTRGLKVTSKGPRRVRVDVGADALPALLEMLKGKLGYIHLTAISCVDWPQTDQIELVYHVWSHETKTMVSAHILIDGEPAIYVSVYDIYTPAGFFERDIHEMYGVHFHGAPNLTKFILTSWDGPPPMRKSFDTEAHVEETYTWEDYDPQWLKDIEAKGGGLDR